MHLAVVPVSRLIAIQKFLRRLGLSSAVAEKIREAPHPEKHHMVIDLLHEIYS
jgi:hypothetical protein